MYIIRESSSELTQILAQARRLPVFEKTGGGYVTVGVFDGVHRGHQQIIVGMAEAARSAGGVAIALVFDPHPAAILETAGRQPLRLLTTVEERAELLATLGLDALIVSPFTKATARTSAGDFVEALIQDLGLIELWGGPDFALGHRREGNVSSLRRLGAERGFSIRVVEPLVWEGDLVSSSRIRAALDAGDAHQATGCLGRPYRLTGQIVHGDGRGGRLGVPTANLSLLPERLIPANGIYVCLARTEHLGTYPAAVNVGTRPTFPGASADQASTVEAYLLDFDGDLYGQTLALDFIARLRDELTFPNIDALIAQMHKDIAQARDILGDLINDAI